jgi:hypothetical protein
LAPPIWRKPVPSSWAPRFLLESIFWLHAHYLGVTGKE